MEGYKQSGTSWFSVTAFIASAAVTILTRESAAAAAPGGVMGVTQHNLSDVSDSLG